MAIKYCVGCGELTRIRCFCSMRCAAITAQNIYEAGGDEGDFCDPEVGSAEGATCPVDLNEEV